MRGEHSCWISCLRILKGSSPHARGTLLSYCTGVCFIGIIPACAGNTYDCCINQKAGRDHPRMRGEHALHLRIRLYALGSSPHARGTHTRHRKHTASHGIIPACAGNTLRNPNNPNPNISLSIDFDSVYIICYQKLIQRL